MGLLPSRKEIKKFGKKNPIRSMIYLGFIGFTMVDVLSSFTLPRGSGPLSKYPAAVRQLQGSTSTTTSTSTSHPPHIVREALINNNLAGFGMTKAQIKAKHPKGTKQSHIDRMHHHMKKGMEFGPAHNQAVKDGFPAMGSVGFHHGIGDHCDTGVGFHHGTGFHHGIGHTTKSQQRKLDKIEGELRKASKMHASQADRIADLGSTSTTTSVSSTHLPPGLRRRMMSRTYESEISGSHLGKQTLSVVDRAQEAAEKNFGDMYGLAGITPETGSGWVE